MKWLISSEIRSVLNDLSEGTAKFVASRYISALLMLHVAIYVVLTSLFILSMFDLW